MSFPYKAEPMSNQRMALKRAWKKSEFALFHEMGTGKTFTSINLSAARYMHDYIEAVLVICPTPIKLVWEDEIAKWCPIDHDVYVLHAGKSSQQDCLRWAKKSKPEDDLLWLVIGVESLSQGKGFDVALSFVRQFRCKVIVDESSTLKKPTTNRTKRAIRLGEEALFRLILTGTPITQGVEDLFSQFKFLNPNIVGVRTFTQFKAKYCITRKFDKFEKIVGYMNVDELIRKVSPYVDIVKKEDVLDLPDKVYERILVDPTPKQLELIKSLKDTMMAEHQSEELFAETMLERLTRFQQIIGGHFPYDEGEGEHGVMPIEGPNPKLSALLEVVEPLDHTRHVIIWARFRPEIELIAGKLRSMYGEGAVAEFHGGLDYEQRKKAVREFTDPRHPCRFMVANPVIGGMGQTWVVADIVVYYSNSFSYGDRMQSEDRAHRKGQTRKVTYVDIEARHKYDQMILQAIARKQSVAQYVDTQITMRQEFSS